LACRGHDESEDSRNKGNFLELLNWLDENFEEVGMVVLKKCSTKLYIDCPSNTKRYYQLLCQRNN
jgi:hypothetical protein